MLWKLSIPRSANTKEFDYSGNVLKSESSMWTVSVLYNAYAEAGEHAGAYAIHIKYDNI